MRVGVIGPDAPDLFADNVADCLPDLGVEVVRLGSALPAGRVRDVARSVSRVGGWFERRLLQRALTAEVDLIVTVETLSVTTVAALRAARVGVALWHPDHVGNIAQTVFAADYTRVYLTDPYVVERQRALTAAPLAYLPEACNPRTHRPLGSPGTVRSVVVAGNFYPMRVMLLDRLYADGVPLRLYGSQPPRWMPAKPVLTAHTHQFVYGEAKARVYRQAAAVLNSMMPSEQGVNCRLFEAAACGATVLCEDRPVLRDLFDVGTEILAFDGYGQLLKQAREILTDPPRIGDAAARRAHTDHTYQQRLQQVLTDCG